MKLHKDWRVWLSSGIGLLCLWLALRSVSIHQIAQLLSRSNEYWLIAAIMTQLAAVVARSQRWVVLLNKERYLLDSFWVQGVGYLITNILPMRMGEPARVVIMSERCNLPIVQVAATALIERILDVATIVLALILVLPWMRVPVLIIQAGVTFGALVLIVLLILIVMVRFEIFGERVLRFFIMRIPVLPEEGIIHRWRELDDGLKSLAQPRVALGAIVWSIVTWAFSIATIWCVLIAFQSDGTILEATFMIITLSLAVTIPSSPGFIGVFQLAGQQALVLPFGPKYDAVTALTIAFASHLVYYLTTSVLGIIGLWRLGETFERLRLKIVEARSAIKKRIS